MSNLKKAGAAGAGALVIAAAVVAPWEGLWLTAKVDRIGTGMPITYCHGQTDEFGKVAVGTKFTPEQCSDMLKKSLVKYADAIAKCIKVPISDKEYAAYISFSYNVGTAGACRSSAFALLNRGNHRGACDALMNWTKAQGRVVKGLVNRRTAERKLCLEGINDPPVKRAPLPQSRPIEAPQAIEPPSFLERGKLALKFIWKGI
jgi:lysozyme